MTLMFSSSLYIGYGKHSWWLMNKLRNWIELLDINATVRSLGNKCIGLLGMHALSGCDTVSFMCGQGKITALYVLQNTNIQGLGKFGEEGATKDELINVGRQFV